MLTHHTVTSIKRITYHQLARHYRVFPSILQHHSNHLSVQQYNTIHYSTRLLSTKQSQDESAETKHKSIELDSPLNEPRESMQYDAVIVGAGPAGLCAAIRLKQLDESISVCIVEKGSEVGAHIISGNVLETRALDILLPDWRTDDTCPIKTKVTSDKFYFLTNKSSFKSPLIPPTLHNHNNYICSLSEVTRWLAAQAESLGVEIYPGFSASEILYDESGNNVIGIATSDMGVDKLGQPKDTFTRGMELLGYQTIFAEGCRGSLSERVINKYMLRDACDPQTYGIGLKEVWKLSDDIAAQNLQGTVIHTVGYPTSTDTYAGSFMYFIDNDRVQIGMVIGLDYQNPYLNPYMEFQTWKTHPLISQYLQGGTCELYGARALNEGGYQSIPKLTFNGGMLVGCSAGFLNVPKIKGTHTAMQSGILAAEAIYNTYQSNNHTNNSTDNNNTGDESLLLQSLGSTEIVEYESNLKNSWIYSELKQTRNIHPSFHKFGGLYPFVLYSAVEAWILRGNAPWTFHNHQQDWEKTKLSSQCQPIEYINPDGKLTFDLLTNLQRSGVYHTDNQPVHLKVKPDKINVPSDISYKLYGAPETRFCPAKVYEFTVDEHTNQPTLVINSQNCIHCKTCSIKTPENYIDWTVPEGSGGPKYSNGM